MLKYTDIVDYIKANANGFVNTMTGAEIGSYFGCTDMKIRKFVNEARSNNIPICSNSNGYYYSESKDDILATVCHLKGRISKVENAIEGMLEYITDNEVAV